MFLQAALDLDRADLEPRALDHVERTASGNADHAVGLLDREVARAEVAVDESGARFRFASPVTAEQVRTANEQLAHFPFRSVDQLTAVGRVWIDDAHLDSG